MVSVVALLLLLGLPARADRLPLRLYTVTDGLGHDRVNRIVQDPHGFLWFCTDGGLSRFDGERFVTFGAAEGLRGRSVMDLLVSREGAYWIATDEGLARLEPEAAPVRFETIASPNGTQADPLRTLFQDTRGRIWVGGSSGLYLLEREKEAWSLRPFVLPLPEDEAERVQVNAIVEDSKGTIWIGTRRGGVYALGLDGKVASFLRPRDDPQYVNNVRALLPGPDGSLWVGSRLGLWRLRYGSTPAARGWDLRLTTGDGLPSDAIWSLVRGKDSTLWVATENGLVALEERGHDPPRVRLYDRLSGFPRAYLKTLLEDDDSNLWIGTEALGALRLSPHGIRSYDEMDGLPSNGVAALVIDRKDQVHAVTRIAEQGYWLHPFREGRFSSLRLLPAQRYLGWGWSQIVLQDRDGDWWVAGGEGLARFMGVRAPGELDGKAPTRLFTTADGLPRNAIFRLFEHSSGDIWISPGPARWQRGTGRIVSYGRDDGFALGGLISAFAEDREGGLWIGSYDGGISRWSDGRFETFGVADGVPAGIVSALHVDASGTLWIGTPNGAARIGDPSSARPGPGCAVAVEGLSSPEILSITSDQVARVYFCTGRGVDGLDTKSGTVRRYTTDDGLMNAMNAVSMRDAEGDIWFGGAKGVSRLHPLERNAGPPPRIRITGLAISGAPRPLSPVGASSIGDTRAPLRLAAADTRLRVDYQGIGFRAGRSLRYQYRLEGADEDWSAPTDQRSVSYASLPSGTYRFVARALDPEGRVSEPPASIAFEVLPPFWRRWWFIAGSLTAIASVTLVAHRARVRRAVEMERVRLRISMDLHDEIGSGLGSIGILAGLLARDPDGAQGRAERASTIASVAEELGSSLTDIVWSLKPGSDTLEALAAQIVERANRLFPPGGIELNIDLPEAWPRTILSLPVCRSVLLIAQEGLHNAARHSGARQVTFGLASAGSRWRLWIADDGRGFDAAAAEAEARGLGLSGMRRRAEEIGAALEWTSQRSGGTKLTLLFSPRGERSGIRTIVRQAFGALSRQITGSGTS